MPPILQLGARIAQGAGHGVERGGKLAEFVAAAHRDRLIEIAGGEPLRPAFEVAQRQIDQTVHEKADQQRREADEAE